MLRAPLSRDHLSVISGITHQGWLHTRVQHRPCRGQDAARFLKHLTTHISAGKTIICPKPHHGHPHEGAFLAEYHAPAPGFHLIP